MMYAAITQGSYYVPGDERSRTNPGHGYPGGTEYYTTLTEFKTEDEMLAWVKRQNQYTKYRIIRYEEVQIKTTLSVEVAK